MSVMHQAVDPEADSHRLSVIHMPLRSVPQSRTGDSHGLSPWTHSFAKRLFDITLVMASLPMLLPLIAFIALAVRLTSRGPVLFLQQRIGRDAKPFTIVKFRTMIHSDGIKIGSVAIINNQRITYVGRILRRWKLDELPQLFNVLRADMSLVGPRPKIPEQQIGYLRCRPGVTGAASLAFAQEEVLLAHIPKRRLNAYYRDVVLPHKQRLDDRYMARATFMSDLRLILKTVFRRWDSNGLAFLPNRLRAAQGEASHSYNDRSARESDYHHVVSHPQVSSCSSNGSKGLCKL